MTALEFALLKFFLDIEHLTRLDNNDVPEIIYGDIRKKIEKFKDDFEFIEDFKQGYKIETYESEQIKLLKRGLSHD